ncbi:Fur family ferric uptake transcriptional regulator [Murinocardiopsis flavida]|uniref:Fur family ferric uptake transcriptional regulator n=1 Tax=Murinocardiopsis flavida TaxID=645275 RepID=A0A2P8DQG8_9ACTN|nr:Fur family transcriptional regulator [Murinocardiopsis flavida]PSK99451.1 Fur family ferric uptake transcriptional regulator [Murinocardiopsis flavida]
MDDATDLREAGLRVTAARLAILEAVRAGDHSDAEHIARDVRAKVGHVSTQAVYDALHALTGARLLRRIEPAGSAARYEARVGDNHHHLVCRRCGAVADTDCVVGLAPCLVPSDTHGFTVDEAEVVFWGVCPQCQVGSGDPRGDGAAKRAP